MSDGWTLSDAMRCVTGVRPCFPPAGRATSSPRHGPRPAPCIDRPSEVLDPLSAVSYLGHVARGYVAVEKVGDSLSLDDQRFWVVELPPLLACNGPTAAGRLPSMILL